MIQFKRVIARNFRSFPKFSMDLDFNGTTLVQGVIEGGAESLESNGAGKSSLFAAVSWALFGKFFHVSGSLVSGDQVIQRSSIGGCEVFLSLESDGREIDIKRFRGDRAQGNKLLVWVDTVDVTRSSNAKTQQELESLLSVSFELFTNLVYVSETSMRGSFAFESDAQRKRILVSALPQLQQFSEARLRAKDDLQLCTSYVSGCKAQIKSLEDALVELDRDPISTQDLSSINTKIIEMSEAAADVYDKITLSTGSLAHTPPEGESVKQEEVQIKKLAGIETLLRMKNQELDKWHSLSKHPTCPTCEQPVDIQFRDDQLHVAQLALIGLQNEKTKQEQIVGECKQIVIRYRQIRDETVRLRHLQQNIDQLKKIAEGLELRKTQIGYRRREILNKIESLHDLLRTAATYEKSFQLWVDGFGPRGVLSLALEHIIEVLTLKAGIWLGLLWHEGATISFSLIGDDLSKIEAKLSLNQQDVDLSSLSSGETRRLCLAICFGLRETLQTLTGWDSNLLVLDEVFDGLDGAGRAKVLQELRNVPETSIFVISQFPQLSQDIQRRAVVYFKDNVSSLTLTEV